VDIAKQHDLDPKHVPERLAKFLETHGDIKVQSVSKAGVSTAKAGVGSAPLLSEQNQNQMV